MHSLFTVSKVLNLFACQFSFEEFKQTTPAFVSVSPCPYFVVGIWNCAHGKLLSSFVSLRTKWSREICFRTSFRSIILFRRLFMFKLLIIGFSVLSDLAAFSDCKSGEFTDENSSDVVKCWKIISEFPGVPLDDRHVSLKNGLNFRWNF